VPLLKIPLLKCLQDKAFSLDCPWWQLRACLPPMELNQTKAQEQRAIHGQQSNNQRTLTAGNDEQEQMEETSAIADSEDQNDQEELSPIESVKSAIGLFQ